MSASQDFLLVRREDLLVVGLRWTGFDVRSGEGVARLVAVENPATIALTFPPQAIAEEKYDVPGDVTLRRARRAGPSRVTFQVNVGMELPLTALGLLEALTGRDPEAVSVLPTGDDLPTAIELPWHLSVSAQPTAGRFVVSDHPTAPIRSPASVVGLWHARLRDSEGGPLDAALALLPLVPNQDDEGLSVEPLSGGQRQSILDAIDEALPRARRLELSTLGGSLTAELRTSTFEWNHETTLGRDRRVRVLMRGVLYPFGHRAEYSVIAERVFDPAGSRTVTGLHREKLLVVTEPVRTLTTGGTAMVRQFPFSEVEILTGAYTDFQSDQFETLPRPRLPDQDLVDEITGHELELGVLTPPFEEAFAQLPPTVDAYIAQSIAQGFGTGFERFQAELMRDRDPEAMRRERADLEHERRKLSDLLSPPEPPPPPPEPIFEDTAPLEASDSGLTPEQEQEIFLRIQEINARLAELTDAAIQAVINERPFWEGEVARLHAKAIEEFETTNTLDEFIAVQAPFNESAADIVRRKEAIGTLRLRIATITALHAVQHDVYWLPRTADGELLRFPVRCAGANGDVFFSVPLIFVKDEVMEPADHFERWAFLTDPAIERTLATAWATATGMAGSDMGVIRLPGVRIDFVRGGSSDPPPGDVHEVHSLTVKAVPHDGGFRPQLTEFEAELPALRGLLPGLPSRRAVTFTRDFLERVDFPEIPLAPKLPIDVDFRNSADRSGGLVSPKFFADGISRSLGVVTRDAVPPVLAGALAGELPPFDLASAYEGATLLGFPLSSLIRLPPDPLSADPESMPKPPAVVQQFAGGIPDGIRMEWTLDLANHGPFRTHPGTKLVLSVLRSRTSSETTCTVNDFSLVLPPGGVEGLLTLSFRTLRFTQREGQAPDLAVDGIDVDFGGALRLLQELQLKLEEVITLPGIRPTVEVRPRGLTAGYGISVPSVPAGTFLIRNIAMHVGVDVPFDSRPVTVSLSFATRQNPFNVSVMAFGGGGYIDLALGPEGLLRLEASIEFGAAMEVDFVIAKGEVHALGGVRFIERDNSIDIDGYIRIGGSVEVLGLVAVSIELVVTLSYRGGTENRLVGRATLVIEIDLTLYSDSVEIDSGEWVLAGSQPRERGREGDEPFLIADERLLIANEPDPFQEWRRYRGAFAPI